MTRQLLIRADDLGYSRAVNYGIYESVHNGIINNVGAMVNMPNSEQGLNLLKSENIDFGVHIDISNGRPISDPKTIPSLVDQNGFFKRYKVYRSAKEDFVNLDEVVQEIEAQYQRFLKLANRKPDYFEGHAVFSDNFIKGLKIVADRHNLDFLPFGSPTQKYVEFRHSNIQSFMDSMLPNYDPYKTFENVVEEAMKDDGITPMMVCHPGYLDQYILNTSSLTIPRVQEVDMACSNKVRNLVIDNQIKLVRYHEL